MIGALMAGRRICLVERFSVEKWSRAVVRHRPKVAPGVPSALRMILEANLPADTFSSLSAIISGTAPLDPRIVDEFLARYDLPILGNYGATEFAGAVAGWSLKDFRLHWKEKRGAAGRLHHDVTARIVDPETGDPLPPGSEGLLELKAPQIGDAGTWRRTTDRAVLDEDKFLFIRGAPTTRSFAAGSRYIQTTSSGRSSNTGRFAKRQSSGFRTSVSEKCRRRPSSWQKAQQCQAKLSFASS